MNNFKKHSDEVLIEMAQGFDDEKFPFALDELANRKHTKTTEICL